MKQGVHLTDEDRQALQDTICDRIAGGESLRAICAEDAMPNKGTVMRWLAKDEEFAAAYTQAQLARAELYGDEVVDLADDKGIPADQKRIMVDARKWAAARLLPKKYGERMALDHGGNVTVTHEQWLDSLK